jgi:transaldolase
MKMFIDTADVDQIREAATWGILDGVTTNPTHVSKTGRSPIELYQEICSLVEGPVSLEAVGLEADQIVAEARQLAKIADNAVIKVPILREGMKAVRRLTAEGIRTNVTVAFSPLQALVAAKAGATYISPFVGRLDNVAHFGMDLVRQIKQIYDNYQFDTEIIVAAVRHPLHVLEAALAGAHVCTMRFEQLEQLYQHPLTDKGVEMFLDDWKKVPGREQIGDGG